MDSKKPVPAQVKWMRLFFKVAGNIAPRAVVPLLVKTLFLPHKRTLKPPHIACLEKGEQFFISVADYLQPLRQLKISCYRWGSGEKKVLLIHGWDAKALDYYKMIPVLVENGYQVVAFDGPAHGQSEGETTNLVHFEQVIAQLLQQIGQPYAIIGHSMGGGAATYFLMEKEVRVKRLALLTIPIVTKRYFDLSFDYMEVPQRLRKALFQSMEQKIGKPVTYYNLLERNEPIKADKIFAVYEKHDQDVSTEAIKLFLKKHPEIAQMSTSGVAHNRIMKDPAVIQAVIQFLK